MSLPLYRSISREQAAAFGPSALANVFECEQHVYSAPFLYGNVRAGDFYEIDPAKGIEFKADSGFLTIREERPIAAVAVVGSGCYARGYNICEWWDEGECVDRLRNQLVKRLRIDNLNSIHPSIFMQFLMQTFPGLTYRDVDLVLMNHIECLKAYSEAYYEPMHLGFYENTAYFRIGPPYPDTVTIRCGCLLPEVPGLPFQPRADYAIRVVDVTVLK